MATGRTPPASTAPEQPPEPSPGDELALVAAAALAGAVLLALASMLSAAASGTLATGRMLAALLRAGLAPARAEVNPFVAALRRYAADRLGRSAALADPLVAEILTSIGGELTAILDATQALADGVQGTPTQADLDAVSAAARSAITAAERAARDVATRTEALKVARGAPADAVLMWHAVGPSPCPACLALDGQPAPYLPPAHPNCQCVVVPETA